MTETTLHGGFTGEAFAAFLQSRAEPAWLADLRREAWKIFGELPLPERRSEEWIRTDIRGFRLEQFALPMTHGEAISPPPPLPEPDADGDSAGFAVSVNSSAYRSSLEPSWAARGVLFGSLEQMAVEHGELLRPILQRPIIPVGYDKFAALQAACWSGGTLLYVPKGVVVDQPFRILSAMLAGGVDLGRCLVVLEDGAEATLLTGTDGPDAAAPGLHCGSVELILGAGARLRCVALQNWGGGVWHFAHEKAVLGRNASLQWTVAALGSRLAKVNQRVALAGEGAHAQVEGVLFAHARQHLSYHTFQHHQAPGCTSDLLYKAAVHGASRSVWRGMIKVDRDAQKTDGYQRNDNLILSESARADSIPGLEIEADDVKCSHGATAGRVDDEQIFYAATRGLSRQEAIHMIVVGFFQQVFDRVPLAGVRRALGEAIGRRVREFS